MKKIDLLDAQKQLAKLMRQTCESGSPITINGMGKDEVVVLSAADYQKLISRNRLLQVVCDESLICNTPTLIRKNDRLQN